MKKNSIVISVLIISMLAGSACTDTNITDTKETDVSVTTVGDTVGEIGEELGLPDDLYFDGDTVIRIINPQGYIKGDGSSDADVVSQELYRRNIKVEEELGVTLEFFDYNGAPKSVHQVSDDVRKSVSAASDDFDVVFDLAYKASSLVYEGMYLPISELPYIDLTNPWWASDLTYSISANANEPYFVVGDMSFNYTERLRCVFFNKSLLDEIHGMTDTDLYQTVLDGKWTLDKFVQLCSDVYNDNNGNTTVDKDDRFALAVYDNYDFDEFSYSVGLEFTSRDEDGYPVIAMNNERTVKLVEKLTGLFINNENVFQLKPDYPTNNRIAKTVFANGQTLFLTDRFYVAGWEELRGMKDEFGIVPYPKFDESIEHYYTDSDVNTLVASVPVTAVNLDAISATMEAMAYYGKQDVLPVYYETVLKIKYTRDDMSAQMIDLITSHGRTDFLHMQLYSNTGLSKLANLFGQLYNAKSNNFSSLYASLEAAANAELENIIESMED